MGLLWLLAVSFVLALFAVAAYGGWKAGGILREMGDAYIRDAARDPRPRCPKHGSMQESPIKGHWNCIGRPLFFGRRGDITIPHTGCSYHHDSTDAARDSHAAR